MNKIALIETGSQKVRGSILLSSTKQSAEAQYSASERLLWVQYQRVVVASASGLI